MSKRFEPSRDRDVLLVLDLEPPDRPPGAVETKPDAADDATEGLIVIAASLIRSLGQVHAAFGLAAAGFTPAGRRVAFLPVSSAPGQMERGLDLLARLSTQPSTSFDRLAAFVARAARDGTAVVVLTGRDAAQLLRPLRSLQRQGLSVSLLASGDTAADAARTARAAGLPADRIDLDGPWRTATRVALAG
jgi:uncharacterized protein (DUF58 family)